jgi:hypothetical protein
MDQYLHQLQLSFRCRSTTGELEVKANDTQTLLEPGVQLSFQMASHILIPIPNMFY